MNFIDIQGIEKLEEYIFALGSYCVSLKGAHELQSKALSCAFLETDERELVQSIQYQLGRSLIAISDLMRLMDQRAIINADEVGERMLAKCKESIKKLQIEP
jgi:predicted transcriptional regulator